MIVTPQRRYLETTLLPRFAAGCALDALVLNIGAGGLSYRELFRCPVLTADVRAEIGCDMTYAAEAIPYPGQSVDGILCLGVFERLDDPMQALRECRRVLKPGGRLLLGLTGIAVPWHSVRDRWRLTPGGIAHVIAGWQVIETQHFGLAYTWVVLQA